MALPVLLRPDVPSKPLSELITHVPGARFVPASDARGAEQITVSGLSVASNDMDADWIFVGVPGGRHGAEFASSAAMAGATVLVTDAHGADIAKNTDLPTVLVDDPRSAAALLAEALYGPVHRDVAKIGITGTNGKTTTTYLTRAALGAPDRPVALFGTLEISTGVNSWKSEHTTHEAPVVQRALALTALDRCDVAVVEVSSHALELGRVDGIHFDVGMFTNLQHDHLDFHGDMDSYLEAKAKLFDPERTSQAVIAVDDRYGRKLARQCRIPVQAVQVLTADDPELGDVSLWRVPTIADDALSGGSSFVLVAPDGTKYQAVCPLPGPANVQDAALALIGSNLLGVRLNDAIENLKAAPPVDGRSHWVQKPSPDSPAVMVDFGHTPEAIEILIDVVRPITEGRLIAVFGTEGDRDASKRGPLAQVFAKKADLLFVTDESPRTENASSIRKQLMDAIGSVRPDLRDVQEVPQGREHAINLAVAAAEPGDLILITGKGAERVQKWADREIPFYDPEVATRALQSHGYLVQNL